MHILPKRILEEEIKRLDQQIVHIQEGHAVREFDEKMNSFDKLRSKIESRIPAVGSAGSNKKRKKTSSRKMSTARPSGNRRKSAAHYRDIRVSSRRTTDPTFEVLVDEIGDEFGREERRRVPEAGNKR